MTSVDWTVFMRAMCHMQDDTLVLDGYGDKTAIEARCEAIRQAVEESTSDYDKCAPCASSSSRIGPLHLEWVISVLAS